jgi:tetratricopeptide (TPR) repeat protein
MPDPKKSARDKQRGKRGPAAQAAASPARSPMWRRHIFLLLGLCLVTLLAYSNSFTSGFVFDNSIVLHDSRIKALNSENLDLIFTQEYWYQWSSAGLYRPLTTLSYLFNYTILGSGDHPATYHWVNFLLHALNISLVYALGLLLLEDAAPAFAMAAIWAVHPALTESVTNIVGRADLLSAAGVLGGLLCHVKASASAGPRKLAWLLGLVLTAAIGIFSKESGVVLIAVMLIYDLACRRSGWWRDSWPGYAALAPPFLVFFWVRSEIFSKLPVVHFPFTDNPTVGAGFLTGRLTAIKVIGEYFRLLLWPARLSCDYSYNQVPLFAGNLATWEDWKAVISLLACLAAAAVGLLCWRRSKAVFFFVAFFFVTLVPTSNLLIPIGTIMAERFLYLPAVAFSGLLVMAVYAAANRLSPSWSAARTAAPVLLATICLAFAARTWARNSDWQTNLTLFTSAVQASPASYKTHMSLAAALNDGTPGGLDKAIAEADRATAVLEPLPDDRSAPTAWLNAGSYYRQRGNALSQRNVADKSPLQPPAEADYRKSLELLLKAQRIESATNRAYMREDTAHGKKASDYGFYQLDLELGRTYTRLGQPRQAIEALQHGLRRRLVSQFFVEIAAAESSLGDLHKATIALIQALMLDTTDTRLIPAVLDLYQQMDPHTCAVLHTGSQISLNPQCPAVHDDVCAASRNMAALYNESGQPAKAAETARTATSTLGCPPF